MDADPGRKVTVSVAAAAGEQCHVFLVAGSTAARAIESCSLLLFSAAGLSVQPASVMKDLDIPCHSYS